MRHTIHTLVVTACITLAAQIAQADQSKHVHGTIHGSKWTAREAWFVPYNLGNNVRGTILGFTDEHPCTFTKARGLTIFLQSAPQALPSVGAYELEGPNGEKASAQHENSGFFHFEETSQTIQSGWVEVTRTLSVEDDTIEGNLLASFTGAVNGAMSDAKVGDITGHFVAKRCPGPFIYAQ